MKRFLAMIFALGVIGFGVYWLVTKPETTDPAALAGIEPDLARGQAVFIAGGCASCHSAEGATGEARLELIGGRAFPSDFGTFYAPNISPDPDTGIGGWSALDLVNALKHGTSPDVQHYYPAFPYATYTHATLEDIVSLHGYLISLPAKKWNSRPHNLKFPFNIRFALGGWKLLFLKDQWVLSDAPTPELERGRYLVEALGHCGECHTPRNALGGMQRARWLSGAPNPSGKGRIPNITPAKLDWSDGELMAYFTTGFTPEFDVVGGEMTEVVENLKQLPEDDLRAIIAYLRAVPAVE
ncbi:MAG: cytochrome c [Paracoccaceae bacterium]